MSESSSVFLSYRRQDSAGYAGRLHDRFSQRWGAHRIFWDLDSIKPGEDFAEVIDATLARCVAVLVLVGRNWADITDEEGRRRIDNPSDFHRIELERALHNKVSLIPVLVGGAKMPSEADLPESIRPFARRQAVEVTDQRFNYDVERLGIALDRILEPAQQANQVRTETVDNDQARNEKPKSVLGGVLKLPILLGLAAVVLAVFVLLGLSRSTPKPTLGFKAVLSEPRPFKSQRGEQVSLKFTFPPRDKDDTAEQAHVILGLVSIHDDDAVPSSVRDDARCGEVPSCIISRMWDWTHDPLIVRGGDQSNAPTSTMLAEIPKHVKRVRVSWYFYQQEADHGNRCVVDDAKPSPPGNMPFLKVVDSAGRRVEDGCWYSYGIELYNSNR